MKKTLSAALLIGTALSSLIFSTAPAFATGDKILICHATHSATNPYTVNEVSVNSVKHKGHLKHEGDIIPATAECMGTQVPVPETDEPAPTVTESPSPEATEPVKGTVPTTPAIVPPHGEPNPLAPSPEAYPAPSVTPNTVNGTPPASTQPTPAPAPTGSPVASATPDRLANTGANDMLLIWGAVGLLALLAGIASVIRVRRKA